MASLGAAVEAGFITKRRTGAKNHAAITRPAAAESLAALADSRHTPPHCRGARRSPRMSEFFEETP